MKDAAEFFRWNSKPKSEKLFLSIGVIRDRSSLTLVSLKFTKGKLQQVAKFGLSVCV